MASPSLHKMRLYLHLVPVFGVVPSLWKLYGESTARSESISETAAESIEDTQLKRVSRQSVAIGLSCICAIALLGASASTQASQMASLRFLIVSSLVGSGYFLLSLTLMFRVATDKSIRLPGISNLSRRLP